MRKNADERAEMAVSDNVTSSGERGMNRFGLIMCIVFIRIASTVVLGLVTSSWVEKRRTDAWRRVAKTLGLPFRGNNDILLNRFPAFGVFSPGTHQRFYNAVEAHAGNIRLTVGDFAYRTFDTRTPLLRLNPARPNTFALSCATTTNREGHFQPLLFPEFRLRQHFTG